MEWLHLVVSVQKRHVWMCVQLWLAAHEALLPCLSLRDSGWVKFERKTDHTWRTNSNLWPPTGTFLTQRLKVIKPPSVSLELEICYPTWAKQDLQTGGFEMQKCILHRQTLKTNPFNYIYWKVRTLFKISGQKRLSCKKRKEKWFGSNIGYRTIVF